MFQEELQYWGLDASDTEPCCWMQLLHAKYSLYIFFFQIKLRFKKFPLKSRTCTETHTCFAHNKNAFRDTQETLAVLDKMDADIYRDDDDPDLREQEVSILFPPLDWL